MGWKSAISGWGWGTMAGLSLCLCLGVLVGAPAAGQSPAGRTLDGSAKPVHGAKKSRHRTAKAQAAAPAEVRSSDPPPPDWPANAKPKPAMVAWNGKDLSISASNSSLRQLLQEVSTATGVKVDQVPSDQRVYGNYGPGAPKQVLSELLVGSGYNVLMVGDQGGLPRQLLLTTKRTAAAAAPGAAKGGDPQTGEEDVVPEDFEQPEPEVMGQQPGMLQNPPPIRSPEQVLQEMQMRQRQEQQGQPGQIQPGQIQPSQDQPNQGQPNPNQQQYVPPQINQPPLNAPPLENNAPPPDNLNPPDL